MKYIIKYLALLTIIFGEINITNSMQYCNALNDNDYKNIDIISEYLKTIKISKKCSDTIKQSNIDDINNKNNYYRINYSDIKKANMLRKVLRNNNWKNKTDILKYINNVSINKKYVIACSLFEELTNNIIENEADMTSCINDLIQNNLELELFHYSKLCFNIQTFYDTLQQLQNTIKQDDVCEIQQSYDKITTYALITKSLNEKFINQLKNNKDYIVTPDSNSIITTIEQYMNQYNSTIEKLRNINIGELLKNLIQNCVNIYSNKLIPNIQCNQNSNIIIMSYLKSSLKECKQILKDYNNFYYPK